MRNTLFDIGLPVLAIAAALAVFGVFVSFAGVSPVDVWVLLFKGAFGDWYSWQNTLQRAAPLMLTALCVAVPGHHRSQSRASPTLRPGRCEGTCRKFWIALLLKVWATGVGMGAGVAGATPLMLTIGKRLKST